MRIFRGALDPAVPEVNVFQFFSFMSPSITLLPKLLLRLFLRLSAEEPALSPMNATCPQCAHLQGQLCANVSPTIICSNKMF